MSRNDLRPGPAQLQQKAILDGRQARQNTAAGLSCPDCGSTTRTALRDGHLVRRCEALNARGISAGCGWFVAMPEQEAIALAEIARIAARVVESEARR